MKKRWCKHIKYETTAAKVKAYIYDSNAGEYWADTWKFCPECGAINPTARKTEAHEVHDWL